MSLVNALPLSDSINPSARMSGDSSGSSEIPGTDRTKPSSRRKFGGFSFPKKLKRILPVAVLAVLAVIAIGMMMKKVQQAPPAVASQQTSLPGPIASQTLNKDFQFPLKDAQGKEIAKISYTIQDAELRDEIIVQGRTANAIQGRTFLILTIKIKNNYDKAVNIASRDYIRLTINGKTDELIAADIHNDPVNVQAISTKITRIGFPINDTDKNLVLHVGEIDGTKQSIPLNLK